MVFKIIYVGSIPATPVLLTLLPAFFSYNGGVPQSYIWFNVTHLGTPIVAHDQISNIVTNSVDSFLVPYEDEDDDDDDDDGGAINSYWAGDFFGGKGLFRGAPLNVLGGRMAPIFKYRMVGPLFYFHINSLEWLMGRCIWVEVKSLLPVALTDMELMVVAN